MAPAGSRPGGGAAAGRRGAGPVRWAADGREHSKSFKGRHLADWFLTGLKDAVRYHRPHDPRTGLGGARGGAPGLARRRFLVRLPYGRNSG